MTAASEARHLVAVAVDFTKDDEAVGLPWLEAVVGVFVLRCSRVRGLISGGDNIVNAMLYESLEMQEESVYTVPRYPAKRQMPRCCLKSKTSTCQERYVQTAGPLV